jgi:3-(3-hydroxy-phenyl)propionate hydroxylase
MAPWGIGPDNARLERHAVYTFRGRWARKWRRGRVLIAGDAAHLMPPFLGQGLCSGLRDAAALAWRLDLAASGRARMSILDSYGSERATHVREIIDEAIAIGRVICVLDPVRAAERDSAMLAELNDPAALTVEPPHPRLGHPSITAQGDDNAGQLSVQGRVDNAGSVGLFDDVVGGSWELIAQGFDPLIAVPRDLVEWFASIGGTATAITADGPVRDVDGTYAAWFAAHERTVVLSRPDFYVFGTGDAEGVAPLLRSLRAALGDQATPSDHHVSSNTPEGASS